MADNGKIIDVSMKMRPAKGMIGMALGEKAQQGHFGPAADIRASRKVQEGMAVTRELIRSGDMPRLTAGPTSFNGYGLGAAIDVTVAKCEPADRKDVAAFAVGVMAAMMEREVELARKKMEEQKSAASEE